MQQSQGLHPLGRKRTSSAPRGVHGIEDDRRGIPEFLRKGTKQLNRVPVDQVDSFLELGLLNSGSGILQKLHQDLGAFDCKDPTLEGGQDRRVPTKASGGVNYRTRTPTKQLDQGMSDGRHPLEDGTNPLPRPISGHSKFSAVGPLFKGNGGRRNGHEFKRNEPTGRAYHGRPETPPA